MVFCKLQCIYKLIKVLFASSELGKQDDGSITERENIYQWYMESGHLLKILEFFAKSHKSYQSLNF